MSSGTYALINSTQSEAQRKSKSSLNGYRKPVIDDGLKWCNCTIPVLVTKFQNHGSATCLRCMCAWYN